METPEITYTVILSHPLTRDGKTIAAGKTVDDMTQSEVDGLRRDPSRRDEITENNAPRGTAEHAHRSASSPPEKPRQRKDIDDDAPPTSAGHGNPNS